MPFTQKVQSAEEKEYLPEAEKSQRRAVGLTAMVIGALANAVAGGALVWFVMKDEPAKLASDTGFALGKLKAAVIDMGCASEDKLGTWYLHSPSEPLTFPNTASSASISTQTTRIIAAGVPKKATTTPNRASIDIIGAGPR